MRVVVTGGAGFIGANLVRELLERDGIEHVVAFDDLSTGHRSNLADHELLTFIEGTLLDLDRVDAACAGADAVVHLGAIPSVPRSVAEPLRSHEANATGTVHVLEVARQQGLHLVVASSSSVYGANPVLPKREDQLPRPRSPYAASKLASEAYTLAYADCFDLDVLVFRFFNVFGPLQAADHAYAAVVPAFISAGLAGRPLSIHGDGMQTRDFTYVGTVTRVLVDAVVRRVSADTPVNLAFGTRTSILELVDALSDAMGTTLSRDHVAARAGDVRDSQADNTLLRELFPDVQPTQLQRGLEQTVRWFRESASD